MKTERLVNLRNKINKTQQEMANLLGITRPAYTAYESGTRKPDYVILDKIASILETSTDYLLGRTDDPRPINEIDPSHSENNNDPKVSRFFKDFNSAPKEKQEETIRFLEFLQREEKDRKLDDKQ